METVWAEEPVSVDNDAGPGPQTVPPLPSRGPKTATSEPSAKDQANWGSSWQRRQH